MFKEDHNRLTEEHARGTAGGSLYGLWQSNGNPVINVAFSDSLPRRVGINEHLVNNFGLCHIGEWRPIITAANNSGECDCQKNARQALLPKYKGQDKEGTPPKFLVLDVSRTKIIPFFFHNQTTQGHGTLKILPGKNPFNNAVLNYNPQYASDKLPAYLQCSVADSVQRHGHPTRSGPEELHNPPAANQQSSVAGQVQQSPGPTRSQSEEAETASHQWYAGGEGNRSLQHVYQAFQSIARSGKVGMARDTQTHDMSMSFIDQKYGKEWEVKFPFDFPHHGARMMETMQGRVCGTTQREHRQPDNAESLQKAVERMIRMIQVYRP